VKEALEAAQHRVEKRRVELEAKREQVAQSQAQGHGKRLKQRQRAATELEDKLREAQQRQADLQERVDSFEAPKERSDRDMRKQTIMTIRTLFLENLLQAFMTMLLSVLPKPVSLEQVLRLLFERSGSRIERDKTVMYWINATGLSRGNRRILDEIVEGLSTILHRTDFNSF
jgi:predicted RNase H-like nuclease (RuvC/YqgF family)